MHGLQHNKNPSVMKAPPLSTPESAVPLSPKVLNTVKVIEKVSDTQIALLLLHQVNNSSLTYTLRTSPSQQKMQLQSSQGRCTGALLQS